MESREATIGKGSTFSRAVERGVSKGQGVMMYIHCRELKVVVSESLE